MKMRAAKDLKPGDRYERWHNGTRYFVEVAGDPMDYEDFFGRVMVKVWCRVEGYGEGWEIFGPDARIELQDF